MVNGDNIPCILFVTKWNLVENNYNDKAITENELDEFCMKYDNVIGWINVSSKTGYQIKKAMDLMINRIVMDKYR